MEVLPKDLILEFKPDTLTAVRRLHNLDGQGRIEEAVKLLQEWVDKQTHFKKKDFSKEYLEKTIIQCKGSVEKAKTKLDKYCSLRTVLPKFFNRFDAKNDFNDNHMFDIFKVIILPKMAPEHNRILMAKIIKHPKLSTATLMDIYRYSFMLVEYIKANDYFNSCIMLLDYTEADITDLMTKMSLVDVTQWFTVFTEGYAMRIHSIHIITASKLVDLILTLFKKALPAKVSGRIRVHESNDTIFEVVPKEIIPRDYGGDERTLQDLVDDWIDVLSSKKHMEHLRVMSEAVTNEDYRLTDKFRSEYMGMEGSFRTLNVD